MKLETIRKSIEINAPKEKVWDVLTNDNFTRIWYAAFSEGTHAETDWKVGSKAIFTDDSKCGLVSKVIDNKPHELLFIEHQGIVTNGIEDYESDVAHAVKGGREIYRLLQKGETTEVFIECDMADTYLESMSLAWDTAGKKIKDLSERA